MWETINVRRKIRIPSSDIAFTQKTEVYEVNISKGAHCWVPVLGGLGGHALFISNFFSKSIPTCDKLDQDALHFIDNREKYNIKSQTMSETWRNINYHESM
jgi:hypothetical protein